MNPKLKKIVEALLISTSEPLTVKDILKLFRKHEEQLVDAKKAEDDAIEAEDEEEDDEEDIDAEEEEEVTPPKKRVQPKRTAKKTAIQNVFMNMQQQEEYMNCESELSEEEYV